MTPNPWMLLLMVVLGAACRYLASVRGVAEDIERPAGATLREPDPVRETEPVRESVVDSSNGAVAAEEERPPGMVDRLRGGATAASARVRGLFRRDREPAEPVEDTDAPAPGRTTMIFAPRLAADAKNAQRPEPVDADPLATDDIPDAPYAEDRWDGEEFVDDTTAGAVAAPATGRSDVVDVVDVEADPAPERRPREEDSVEDVTEAAVADEPRAQGAAPTRTFRATDEEFEAEGLVGTPLAPTRPATEARDESAWDAEFDDQDLAEQPLAPTRPTRNARNENAWDDEFEDDATPAPLAPTRPAADARAENPWADEEFDDEFEPRPLRVPTDVPAPVDDELAAPPAAEPLHPHPVRLPAPETDLTGDPAEPDEDDAADEPAPPRTPRRATSPATTPRRPEPLFVEADEDDDVMDLVDVVDIEPAPYPRYQAVPPRPAPSPHRQTLRPDPADTLFDDDPR